MSQWRTPTEEEATYLLPKLKKQNLFDQLLYIIMFATFAFALYMLIINLIDVYNNESDKTLLIPVALFIVFVVFILGLLIYLSIRNYLSVKKYKNREIIISYCVLKDKFKRRTGKNTYRYFAVEFEDGSSSFHKVRGGIYRNTPVQSKMIAVRMDSTASMWKKHNEIYPAQ